MKQNFLKIHQLNARKAFGYGAMAFALAFLPACSDDDDLPDKGEAPSPVEMETNKVTIGNDPSAQSGRITFYGESGRTSRAADNFPSIGEAPKELPTDAPEFNSPGEAQQSSDTRKNQAYILKGGEGQIELYGDKSVVYITGTVTTHNFNGTSGTVYVMPDAKLILKSGCNVQSAKIYAFGELETQGDLTLGAKGTLLIDKDLTVKGRFAVEGTCVAKGKLNVDNCMQMNSSARVKAMCIYVDGDNNPTIKMDGNSEMSVRNYLSTPYLYMNGGTVYLYPYAMAETGTTKMTSDGCKFEYYSSIDKHEHALLNTETFEVEGGADNPTFINEMFAHELKLDYKTLITKNSDNKGKFKAPATDYFIPSNIKHSGCNPGHGIDKPTFDNVVDIESPHTHTHLSATCVQWANGHAYVSYHLNEAYTDDAVTGPVDKDGVHQGCIEVIDVNESNAQISSWMMDNTFDINHAIVDNNRILMTGDKKGGVKGGYLGVIELSAGVFKEDNGSISVAQLEGGSGNCIVPNSDHYILAVYDGFQTSKIAKDEEGKYIFEEVNPLIKTNGSAKHIAKNGNVIATLHLDSKSNPSTATVSVYNGWGTNPTTFNVGEITPINGKNTIAIDGDDIYVCLGENGVGKFGLNGNAKESYNWISEHLATKPEYKGKPCANGIAIDEKYVYIAYGGAGLVVLDKNTMKRVARYYHKEDVELNKEYSANYVALVNDYIYIAYGRNGLEVVKMREPVDYKD